MRKTRQIIKYMEVSFMNNNEVLIKKFHDSHENGYPTFLCGSKDTDALLAYPTISDDGRKIKMVYISSTLEEITVNVLDVGKMMFREFAKYALFFDEDAAYSIIQFFNLSDDANAVSCKKKDLGKTIDGFFNGERYARFTFNDITDILRAADPELFDKFYSSLKDCEDEECPHCAAMKKHNKIENAS